MTNAPIARVVADAPGNRRPALGALTWLSIALLASAVFRLGQSLWNVVIHLRIRDHEIDYKTDAVIALAEKLRPLLSVTNLILSAAMVVSLLVFALHLRRVAKQRETLTQVPRIALWAAVFAVLNFAVDIFFFVGGLVADYEWMMELYQRHVLMLGLSLLHLFGTVMLLWSLISFAGRSSKRQQLVSLLAGLAAGWISLQFLYRRLFHVESPWWTFILSTLPALLIIACTGLMAWWGRRSMGPLPEAASEEELKTRWLASARGLGMYASALQWRLILTIIACGVLYLGVKSYSLRTIEFIGWALPLASLVTSIVMSAGMVGFSRQPGSNLGRARAQAAAGLMIFVSVADLSLLYVVVARAKDDMYEGGMEIVQAFAAWSMILGFVAVITLLASLGSAVRRFGGPELVGKVGGVVALMLAAAATALGLRFWIASGPPGAGEVLAIGASALVLVTVAVVKYIALLRQVERAINRFAIADEGDDPQAPPAFSLGGKVL